MMIEAVKSHFNGNHFSLFHSFSESWSALKAKVSFQLPLWILGVLTPEASTAKDVRANRNPASVLRGFAHRHFLVLFEQSIQLCISTIS